MFQTTEDLKKANPLLNSVQTDSKSVKSEAPFNLIRQSYSNAPVATNDSVSFSLDHKLMNSIESRIDSISFQTSQNSINKGNAASHNNFLNESLESQLYKNFSQSQE